MYLGEVLVFIQYWSDFLKQETLRLKSLEWFEACEEKRWGLSLQAEVLAPVKAKKSEEL